MSSPIHLRRFGAPHAPPLLLVHGLGSGGSDWAFQIEPLAQRFQVLVADLPGSGRSPPPPRHGIAEYATSLLQGLAVEGIARCGVLGFSLGGAVALEMALSAPERVSRLMTINSLASYRVDSAAKWVELYLQLNLVRLLGLRPTAKLVSRRLFPHPHQAAMRQRVIDVLGAQPRDTYLAQARALARWCALDRVQAHAGKLPPTLMLAAALDYTPLAEKQALATRIGAELRVVEGSRHGTPFDAIQATNSAALAFFAGEPVPETLRIDAPHEAPAAPPAVLAALE
ncbi:MAG: alpha/beta hydrolase [Xanthomonadales bacterium]|jgi:pimeloyl-ACP methyl ester carboxylesterase|nr:alpha/beta hydrolase [Xanthomonadales bacterium]